MFIDTNVLVNARILEAPDHDLARAQLERAFQDLEPLRISRQVVREYLSVVTRPQTWSIAIAREDALADVDRLTNGFEMLEDGPEVTQSLLALCREVTVGGRQIHDANIVATMLAHGEHRLLTFNTADFRRYGDRIELVDSA
ncbi:MAG: PIN domain-containing protein [Chloroflexota bacterium]|nr:PIN domain-containing protein [Chloroflexota bacterium]MDE2839970.1 PIN domain-containing protein [Chloroflexota bacterium]MDE2929638.1 PIN domain-containing protein [Chloroflexota bacterium]